MEDKRKLALMHIKKQYESTLLFQFRSTEIIRPHRLSWPHRW